MAVAPSVQNSTEPTDAELASRDQLSPTTLVLQALRKAGVPITNDNIRRFVSANAREGGQFGPDLISGLRSGLVEDSGPSVGQQGSSAADVRRPKGTGAGSSSKGGSGDNPPMVDLGRNPYGDEPRPNPTQPNNLGGTPSNVATPQGGAPMMVDPGTGTPGILSPSDGNGPDWLSALTPTIIAALVQGAGAFAGRGSGAEFVGNAQMPSGRMMDVNPPAIGADGIPTLQVTGPRPQIAGPQAAPPPPSPMEMSMQNAMRPPLGGPIGPSLPPQPTGPGTTIIPPNPATGAPQVPLRPGAGARGPMPGVGAGLGQRILRGLRIP